MIPLFFQDGVRQQWTAWARTLMRDIDPQLVEDVRLLASEGARVGRRGNPAGDVKPGRAVAVACLVAVSLAACDRLADRQVEQALTRTRTDLLKSPDLHVVLCGTGTPLPDPARAGACTAIIAGGELVLVDVGPGSWETVDLANLPTAGVSAILLTHFHSDPIGDLGEAGTQSWIAGRTKPLDVYGPPGVAQVVEGFDSAYAFDAAARVAHHRESHMPAAAGRAIAHEVAMPNGDGGALVFDRNGCAAPCSASTTRPSRRRSGTGSTSPVARSSCRETPGGARTS